MYEIKNAIIESAEINCEGGFLTVWITFDYGGVCQAFGGHRLYMPKGFDHHRLNSVAGHFIYRVMEVAGVSNWKYLKGKTVRVNANHCNVKSIGHIVKDDWFCPSIDFEKID